MKHFLIFTLLMIATVQPGFAGNDQQHYALNIPRQSLDAALKDFSKQTGLQIARFADTAHEDVMTGPVTGSFSAADALKALLAPSGLAYKIINDRMVAVGEPARLMSTDISERMAQIQLAQIDNPSSGAQATAQSQPPVATERGQEIVVTGSHIRGDAPAGSKVITITSEDIEHSGHARLEDFFENLPQNFSGTAAEDDTGGGGRATNNSRGATVDLRGLGAGTTLVLVNGHRQPAGSTQGEFVDISMIATSAIERIEILADGASAIYGSDAIGGVVNFILRKDYEGAETRLRFGSMDSQAEEIQVSQLFGKSWQQGNVLLGYQYQKLDDLPYGAVDYLATNGDQRRFGGSDFRTFGANPGVILDAAGQPAYAIPEGQNGTGLTVSALLPGVVRYRDWSARSALPQQEIHGAFLRASQAFNERLELYVEGRYAQRTMFTSLGPDVFTFSVPSSNPWYLNPFGGSGPVRVAYSFEDDLGMKTQYAQINSYAGTVGGAAALGRDWQLDFHALYARESNAYDNNYFAHSSLYNAALASSNPSSALNVFGDGSNTNPETLRSLRGVFNNDITSKLPNFNVTANGPLFDGPGGTARLAVGVDYRKEEIQYKSVATGGPDRLLNASRRVDALFAELAFPLIGQANAGAAARRLQLSLAGRYEEYDDFGQTFNPKLGLSWMPLDSLNLRSAWGTSFRAPAFHQSIEGISAPAFGSARVGTERVLQVAGPNAELTEETADFWTMGLDFTPAVLPALELSLTYFQIDYEDKIGFPPAATTMLAQESYWADLINRSPTPAQIQAICTQPTFSDQAGGGCGAPVAAIIDRRARNLAVVKVRGMDIDLDHRLDTAYGAFSWGVGASYLFDYNQAATESLPALDILDTLGNPLSLRLRAKASWTHGQWSVNAFVNHMGSYQNPGDNRRIDSSSTFDMGLSYRTAAGQGWLENARFALNATNVFDELPPFVNEFDGYDNANGNVTGRKLSLTLVKEW